MPDIADLLHPVEETIATKFLPSLFDQQISEMDQEIYAIPTRLGGLSNPCLDAECNFEFNASKLLSAQLVDLIEHQSTFLEQDHH